MNELVELFRHARTKAGQIAEATKLRAEMTREERDELADKRLQEILHRYRLKYPEASEDLLRRIKKLSKKDLVPEYYRGERKHAKRNIYDLLD